jgi:hypothetical protein
MTHTSLTVGLPLQRFCFYGWRRACVWVAFNLQKSRTPEGTGLSVGRSLRLPSQTTKQAGIAMYHSMGCKVQDAHRS